MRLKKQTLGAIVALAFSLAGCSTLSSSPAPAGRAPSASQGTSSDPIRLVDLPREFDSGRSLHIDKPEAIASGAMLPGRWDHRRNRGRCMSTETPAARTAISISFVGATVTGTLSSPPRSASAPDQPLARIPPKERNHFDSRNPPR